MRANARASRASRASIAMSAALLAAAALVAGCRTAGVGGSGGSGGGGKAVALATPPALQKTVSSVEASEIAALPDGPSKSLVTERCLLCHGAGLITAQRKDAAAWGRTVTQMRTWGTPIQDEDQNAIVAYLTQHYGKTP
jgi:cytochrome c5